MFALFFNDLSGITPPPYSLSPVRGEGVAIGRRDYFFGDWHTYDGVQRTARPTKFGSWVMGSSDRSM